MKLCLSYLKKFSLVILCIALSFTLTSCNKGGGSSGFTGTTLSGTGATGKALANGDVEVKDTNGTVVGKGKTDSKGKYSLNVGSTATPYFVSISGGTIGGTPNTKIFYSMSSKGGNVNIHPLSNLMLHIFYKIHGGGKTLKQIYMDYKNARKPTTTELGQVKDLVKNMLSSRLGAVGKNPMDFDLISTPFSADGTGFDKLLDQTRVTDKGTTIDLVVNDGTNTQTSTITPDGTKKTAQYNTLVKKNSNGNILSNSSGSANFPPVFNPDIDIARQGVMNTLEGMKKVINAKGKALTSQDLTSFFTKDFIHNGKNRATKTTELANLLAGKSIYKIVFDFVSYDSGTTGTPKSITGNILFLRNMVTIQGGTAGGGNAGGGTAGTTVIVPPSGITSPFGNAGIAPIITLKNMKFKQSSASTSISSWLFWGNQKKISIALIPVITQSQASGVGASFGKSLYAQLDDPGQLLLSATINSVVPVTSGQVYFSVNQAFKGSLIISGVPTQWKAKAFMTAQTPFPTSGTAYDVTVKWRVGGSKVYRIQAGATGGFAVGPTNSNLPLALKDANLGGTLKIQVNLSKVALDALYIHGNVYDTSGKIRQYISGTKFPVNSTVLSISLPKTVQSGTQNLPTVSANVVITAIGRKGELSTYTLTYK